MRDPIYEILAIDKDDNVRLALAENPHISKSIQKTLSIDNNDDIVTALSFNPNLSNLISKLPRMVELKKNGKNYAVERIAPPKISLSEANKKELLKHKTRDSLTLISLNSNSYSEQLNLFKLLNEINEIDGEELELFIWAKIAFLINETTEEELISGFEKSKNQSIQEAIAGNIKSPLSSLKKLLKKKNTVRCYLANPNHYLPAPFFNTLIDTYKRDGLNGIKKSEKKIIDFYSEKLDEANKPSLKKLYKALILENGGIL